ncbi:MAG: hypothetical protein Q7T59_05685 [Candidatus Woesebacteria bacterium]|nr:hypothetical protein [Candidatus Woesebacteria bacterium]
MSEQKQLVMDIAMNLNRIGNWIADDFDRNNRKINIFIQNTDSYIGKVEGVNSRFQKTWDFFLRSYLVAKKDLKNNAESLMTLGNILSHRAKFI